MPKSLRIASNTTPSRLFNIRSYRTYWQEYAVNSTLNFQRALHRQLLLVTQQYERDLGSGFATGSQTVRCMASDMRIPVKKYVGLKRSRVLCGRVSIYIYIVFC